MTSPSRLSHDGAAALPGRLVVATACRVRIAFCAARPGEGGGGDIGYGYTRKCSIDFSCGCVSGQTV